MKALAGDNPNMNHDNYDEESEDDAPLENQEEFLKERIHSMLREMEKKAKQRLNYLELEGFIQKTDIPGLYEYTPEGIVAVREQYKKMTEI